MNYRVSTPIEAQAVLQALRKSRKMSQAALGNLLGVRQSRIANIEAAPGKASFDQISRLVSALGARVVIEVPETGANGSTKPDKTNGSSTW